MGLGVASRSCAAYHTLFAHCVSRESVFFVMRDSRDEGAALVIAAAAVSSSEMTSIVKKIWGPSLDCEETVERVERAINE